MMFVLSTECRHMRSLCASQPLLCTAWGISNLKFMLLTALPALIMFQVSGACCIDTVMQGAFGVS
jgi:hypothetical protein